jgi:hypothetical protein
MLRPFELVAFLQETIVCFFLHFTQYPVQSPEAGAAGAFLGPIIDYTLV